MLTERALLLRAKLFYRSLASAVEIASALLPSFPDSPDAGVAKCLVQLPLGLALLCFLVVLDFLEGRLHLRVVLQSAARVQEELVDAPESLLNHMFAQIY